MASSFSQTRFLALATLSGVVALGISSGVFGTFSTTILSGQSCSGYGFFSGYGYGYNCTVVVSGGGGGGSSNPPASVPLVPASSGVTITPPAVTPAPITLPPVTEKVFADFVAECAGEVTDLTDPRLQAYYSTVGVSNAANTGRKLTRAEFVKLMLNAGGIDVSREADPSYSDVSATHSLRKYIAYATRAGIVSGQNGKFRPNDLISRAEVAKIIVRATNVSMATVETAFADVGSNSTLATYIQTAFDNCILHGRKTNGGEPIVGSRVFEPADGITLAETIKVLYNVSH
jgi:S-layer homology domain